MVGVRWFIFEIEVPKSVRGSFCSETFWDSEAPYSYFVLQLQAYCLVLDDIADGSITRRGMPCWYLREDVGVANAVNDATLIHYALLQILRANFEKFPNYVNMFHNFNEVCKKFLNWQVMNCLLTQIFTSTLRFDFNSWTYSVISESKRLIVNIVADPA